MMKVSRGSKGFTLIELLIVVAIIGILAAIAIPAYTGYTTKSKIAGIVHAMGGLKNAVLAYYTEVGPQAGGTVFNAALTQGTIEAALNVAPPDQYATFGIDTAGVITATIGTAAGARSNVGGNADGGTLVLTPNRTVNPWIWTWTGTGGADQYKPKGT
jgi:type IV pilus assembly protein PilA